MPTYDVEITRYKLIPQYANLKITAATETEAKKMTETAWDDAAVEWSDYDEPDYMQNEILVLGEAK